MLTTRCHLPHCCATFAPNVQAWRECAAVGVRGKGDRPQKTRTAEQKRTLFNTLDKLNSNVLWDVDLVHVKTAKIYAFCAVCERRRLICHYQEGCDECENLRCLRMLHLSPSGVKIFEPSMLSANVASVAVAPVVLA